MTMINQPRIDVAIKPAQLTQSTLPQRVLFVGQKTPSGTATSGSLVESIGNNQADTLFGTDSMIAAMVNAAKVINEQTRFDAIPLDDNGSAVDATGTFVITGPATEAGVLTFTVASSKKHVYEIAIADTDTETVIGDALETAITADTKSTVTAANVAGTVTLTAKNGGEEGNSIGLGVSGEVAGVGVTITAMTGGALNPILTGIFDVLGNDRYQHVVFPASYGFTFITDFLDPRFNATNNVLDGVGITSVTDTLANIKALVNAENSQSLVVQSNTLIDEAAKKGSAIFELDYVIAAQIAAIRSLRLLDGANVSRYVTSARGALDNFGGAALASLPYFNTPLFDLPLIPTGEGWLDTEIEELLAAGAFVIGNNRANNTVICGEIVTTYKNDSAGNPDDTFKFLNYVDTSVTIREVFFNNLKARFAQSRLTEGDLQPGRSMANEQVIRGFLSSVYDILSKQDFVLTQAGQNALNFFKDNLTVTLDTVQGRATVTMKTPIVVQLREILATMEIAFSTNS